MRGLATARAHRPGTAAAWGAVLLLLPRTAGASGPAGTLAAREAETSLTPVGAGYYHHTVRMDPLSAGFKAATFTQDQYFVEMAREIFGWGGFFRAGGATFSDEDSSGEKRFDEGAVPFVAAGFRYLAPLSDDGATLLVGTTRFSYTFRYDGTDRKDPADPVPDKAEVKDFWGVETTAALQHRFGSLVVFGGPAVQFYRLKVVRTEAASVTVESSYDTASNLFGVVGGFRVDLGRVTLQTEAQQFETLSYGGTLSYRF